VSPAGTCPAAVGFGVPAAPGTGIGPYLAIKGVGDIGVGLITVALLIAAPAYPVAWFLAAARIPLGDMLIVSRGHGPRATAYGIHGMIHSRECRDLGIRDKRLGRQRDPVTGP
jgi:hypothetical protein